MHFAENGALVNRRVGAKRLVDDLSSLAIDCSSVRVFLLASPRVIAFPRALKVRPPFRTRIIEFVAEIRARVLLAHRPVTGILARDKDFDCRLA